MRVNKYVAQATGISRRAADAAVEQGKVRINDIAAQTGQDVTGKDTVTLDGQKLVLPTKHHIILLNKPAGYVVSKAGQGSETIYNLLPSELQRLKPVGRLDKASSGLLLLTDDGELAHALTHPSQQKMKCYEIALDRSLTPEHWKHITKQGVALDDGRSKFDLRKLEKTNDSKWLVTMYEGRNRQIRRTFAVLGYEVVRLHRIQFGPYKLPVGLRPGAYTQAQR